MPKNIRFRFNSPDESPGYLLWQVTMQWQRVIKKRLDPLGITHTQFVLLAALAWLSRGNETVTQTAIAAHSNTDRMMVSKVLRTLEEKGWLNRQEHPADTRAKTLSLTKTGSAVLQKALNEVEKADLAFFSVLNNKQAGMTRCMKALVDKNEPVDTA